MGTFGENMRRVRKVRGLSLDALAEMIGTSKQVLSRYENGERLPKISAAKKIAEVLQINLAELTGDEDKSDDDIWQIREDFRRNPELRTLWDLTRKASKTELKQMEAFIRAIRSSNDEDTDTP